MLAAAKLNQVISVTACALLLAGCAGVTPAGDRTGFGHRVGFASFWQDLAAAAKQAAVQPAVLRSCRLHTE